jgi:hypothetical protein
MPVTQACVMEGSSGRDAEGRFSAGAGEDECNEGFEDVWWQQEQ